LGRCPKGLRYSTPGFFVRGQAFHAIAAMTTKGFVAAHVTSNPLTADEFDKGFRAEILPLVKPGSVIVIDNWAGHHADAGWIRAVYQQGGRVEFLPAYSPVFQPIETGFFHSKRFMQAAYAMADAFGNSGAFLRAAMQTVSADAARMAFHTCQYKGTELFLWGYN
jgi:hypothetical protein